MRAVKKRLIRVSQHFTKVIWKLDRIFLGRRLRLLWENWGKRHPEQYFDTRIEGMLNQLPVISEQTISVNDVLLSQFNDGKCAFYDITVRLLAIEQYYGKNSIGYDLYTRMQKNSGNGSFWKDRFIKLIQSYEKEGFDVNMSIDVDENLVLLDGAHRLSLALYHGLECIPVKIHKGCIKRRWTYSFFEEMQFSKDEMNLIHRRTVELFNSCK